MSYFCFTQYCMTDWYAVLMNQDEISTGILVFLLILNSLNKTQKDMHDILLKTIWFPNSFICRIKFIYYTSEFTIMLLQSYNSLHWSKRQFPIFHFARVFCVFITILVIYSFFMLIWSLWFSNKNHGTLNKKVCILGKRKFSYADLYRRKS